MRRIALGVLIVALTVASVVVVRAVRHHGPTEFQWTALGDSYSSGLGEIARPLDCARDVEASYVGRAAALLQRDGYRVDLRFAPCSGATLDDVGAPQSDKAPAQIDSVDPSVQVVTMTLGGNDAGFGKIISSECLLKHLAGPLTSVLGLDGSIATDCLIDPNNPGNAGGEATGWTGIEDELVKVMQEVLAKMAPTGHLFVLTYPLMFSDPVSWGATTCNGFTAENARALDVGVIRMGDAISRAVGRVDTSSTRAQFVDWREQTSEAAPWAPHGLCGDDTPWVHGIRTLEPGGLTASPLNSFHPTAAGYAHAADLLSKAIDDTLKKGKH
jgi:lysophospholipase L1-like esterase